MCFIIYYTCKCCLSQCVGRCCYWEWGGCGTCSASLQCSDSKAVGLPLQDSFHCKSLCSCKRPCIYNSGIVESTIIISLSKSFPHTHNIQANPIISLLNTLQASGLQPPPSWIIYLPLCYLALYFVWCFDIFDDHFQFLCVYNCGWLLRACASTLNHVAFWKKSCMYDGVWWFDRWLWPQCLEWLLGR